MPKFSHKKDRLGGHVVEVGRWRIRVKFGRYRFGIHRGHRGMVDWGAGFCTGNVMRRSARPSTT